MECESAESSEILNKERLQAFTSQTQFLQNSTIRSSLPFGFQDQDMLVSADRCMSSTMDCTVGGQKEDEGSGVRSRHSTINEEESSTE